MATVDSLSVRVTGDSDSFSRAISSAERDLAGFNPDVLQTAAALQALQGRADEAGDEIRQIGPRATVASVGLNGLSVSALSSSTAFAGLSAATVATLIPALTALSTVVFPLTAALGGFVAIAASIAGIGLVGTMAAIATNTEQLKNEALDVIATLQDAFAPAIEEATTVLIFLMRSFEDIIPELVPSQEAIDELGGLFLELGRAIIELLPAFVELGVTLAREFLPGFIEFVENVGPQLPGIIRGMVDAFVRLLPSLQVFGRWLMDNGATLVDFGFTVLSVVIPAIGRFGDIVAQAANFVNGLDSDLQQLITKATLLAPVVTLIATVLGGPLALAFGAITAAIVGFNRAWQTNFLGIRDDLQRVRGMIQSVLPAMRDAFQSFISGVDLAALSGDLSELGRAVDQELTRSLKALQPVFSDVQTLFEENEEEFRIIGGAVGFLAGALLDAATVAVRILGPAFRDIVIPVIRGVIDILDFAISKLAQFIQVASEVKQGDIAGALDATDEFLGSLDPVDVSGTLQQSQQSQQRIEIVLDEQTDVIDSRIREGAQGEIRTIQRRNRRNTGGTSGLQNP